MRETDRFQNIEEILKVSKNLGIEQNVSIRVLDKDTGDVVSEHIGHNSATNSLIVGIAHYLVGEGILNQGYEMLHKYIPLYISLGTMGLISQEEDEEGLPADLGVMPDRTDVDDEDGIAILEAWEQAVINLDRIENGYQYVDSYGDTLLDENDDPYLEKDLSKYIYPPDDTDETKRAILEEWGYKPKVDHCVYYVRMIDTGIVDNDDNVILQPECKPSGEPVWQIAKGTIGLHEAIDVERQCPYCTEGVCLMHPKCLQCVFPERKILIDKLQQRYDEWLVDYEAAKAIYDKAYDDLEVLRFNKYLDECPGFGADGSCGQVRTADNNFRKYFGLGPVYAHRENILTVDCELISATCPRQPISYREIVPETESELQNTVDIVFSALISTGALKQFREPGKDYLFITEAGLWSDPDWNNSGENGLLAGYRIVPTDKEYWDMSVPENRHKLKEQILKVGLNQIVQVVWKIQVGGVDQFEGMRELFFGRNYRYSHECLFGHIPTHYPYPEIDSE